MSHGSTELGNVPRLVGITIPASDANGGCGNTLRALIAAAGVQTEAATSIEVIDVQPGTDPDQLRPGFVAASPRPGKAIASTDFTDHGHPVAPGQAWYRPSQRSLDLSVRSLTTDAFAALVIIYA